MLTVTIDYDGVLLKLMIILMIELVIWVIRVSGNFIRSGDTFQFWSGLVWSIFGNLHFVNTGSKYIVKIFTKSAKLSVLKFLE